MDGRYHDAIRIGREPRVRRAGGPGLRARLTAAVGFEAMGLSDSAVALYEQAANVPFGDPLTAPPALVLRSYALRRLAGLGGDVAISAREELSRDWADAEPEFRSRVAAALLGRGR